MDSRTIDSIIKCIYKIGEYIILLDAYKDAYIKEDKQNERTKKQKKIRQNILLNNCCLLINKKETQKDIEILEKYITKVIEKEEGEIIIVPIKKAQKLHETIIDLLTWTISKLEARKIKHNEKKS